MQTRGLVITGLLVPGLLDRIQSKRLVTAALAQKILGQAPHLMANDRFDLPPFAVPERLLVKAVIHRLYDFSLQIYPSPVRYHKDDRSITAHPGRRANDLGITRRWTARIEGLRGRAVESFEIENNDRSTFRLLTPHF